MNAKFALTLMLLASQALANESQPSVKKARHLSHLAFYKWITKVNSRNELGLSMALSSSESVGRSEPEMPAANEAARSADDDEATSGSLPLSKEKNDALENDDWTPDEEAKLFFEALRPRRSRRVARRRCATTGLCRRGPAGRLLRALSAKFPSAGVDKFNVDSNSTANSLTPDLLAAETSSAQVLMSLDKVRDDFCKTQPFAQKIELPGCHTKTIVNNLCYGQCNSFYIPTQGDSPFRTCGSCEAAKTQRLRISLVCPGRPEGIHVVPVDKILSCRCSSHTNKSHV